MHHVMNCFHVILSWPTHIPLKQTKMTIRGSLVSIYSLLLSHFTEIHFHKLRGPIDSHMFSPVYSSSLVTSGLERGVL